MHSKLAKALLLAQLLLVNMGWAQTLAPNPPTNVQVQMGPSQPSGTQQWEKVPTPVNEIIRMAAADDAGNLYYVSRTTGVWRSTDDGAHWTPINTGVTGLTAWAINWDPVNKQLVLGMMAVSNVVRFYRSTDRGMNWFPIPNPVSGTTTVNNANVPSYQGVAENASGQLLDGGFYPPSPHNGGWYSTDGGVTTHETTLPGLPGGAGQWAAAWNPITSHFLFGTEQQGLFESTDGINFSQVFGPCSSAQPGAPTCGNMQGISWDGAGRLLAGGQGGVWKATGVPGSMSYTWTPVVVTQSTVVTRALFRDSQGNNYWGHSHNKNFPTQWPDTIWLSTDGGAHWAPEVNNGIPTGLEAWSFFESPSDGKLYVTVQDGVNGNLGYIYRTLSQTAGACAPYTVACVPVVGGRDVCAYGRIAAIPIPANGTWPGQPYNPFTYPTVDPYGNPIPTGVNANITNQTPAQLQALCVYTLPPVNPEDASTMFEGGHF